MKTIRELINLIETAQNPVDRTVRVLPDVGEIGIDSDASPGNGSWYVKLYDGSYDVVGFNSEAEAWRELSSLQDLDTGDNDEQGVAEAQLDEATSREILLGLLDKFYADMKLPPRQGSLTGLLDIKSPGTKVWTRGDGTRHRDPGRIKVSYWADDKKQAEKAAAKFWPWLLKQPGVKSIGQVSGEFGSSAMSDAVSYGGLYFSGGPYGTEFGSMSRVKNPKSVWRHKPFELEPKAEQGVTEDLIDHDAAEPLARHFAELYYNGLSSADEAKMAARVYQQVVDGEMSIEQLKQHIAKLEKEKGVAEGEATAQKYAVRMNAQQLGSTNRTKYTWTGTASSDDQAREMAIAYADRHGFKNIVVKEISKKE